ncbi:MAG: tRNA-dihydrouridine synthase family protein, partial [Oscillospiraceae bacterium]|nr:tRNA-dihydrouridine synthase family protein [Oscillospiraceae bacterium]
MRYYFAPMEGLTDSIYRRLHHKYFGGIDRYYMPFISPTIHRTLTHKEDRDLPMADSVDFCAIPQILTKIPEDFLWAAQVCADRGYQEVNLNVGCPSGTVVSKGKGSGMLRSPAELDAFLEAIFKDSPLPISVKTRLGLENPEDFVSLLEVFNRYPIKELTIHPRVRKDFYKEPVREEWFRYAYENSKNPLCYNGNIMTKDQADSVSVQYS